MLRTGRNIIALAATLLLAAGCELLTSEPAPFEEGNPSTLPGPAPFNTSSRAPDQSQGSSGGVVITSSSGATNHSGVTGGTSAVTGATSTTGGATSTTGGATSTTGGASSATSNGPLPILDVPAPTTRTARLSHEQYENAVRDLFMLTETNTTFSSAFRTDPAQAGFLFKNGVLTMEVDQLLWDAYQDAAEEVAEFVMTDPVRRARILPAGSGTDAERAAAFIASFGARAHRRPLRDTELTAYTALFNSGRTLYTGVPALEAGIRLVVEAMLQSPYFLYRVEESGNAQGSVIPLAPFEAASRLSFTLWNTMPDDALFAAARDGSLLTAAGVRTQAARMLASPRASAVVYAFHQQLFTSEKFGAIHPSSTYFPTAPATLGQSAAREHELFLKDLFENGGSYNDVLTSNRTFVNQDLAAVYGLPGTFGTNFQSATLDPGTRRGILTQVGFLASNATAVNPDPIHRGVFISRILSCNPLSAPPANITPVPMGTGDRTNRQLVEAHTEVPDSNCISCHGLLINPYGFPFENYDATGAWRTTDNGLPVNPVSNALVNGDVIPVANAAALIDALAASPEVHACYVQRLVEFTHGRTTTTPDRAMISRLGTMSLANNLPLKDLMADLVSSPAFLNRSVEELP